MIYAIVGPTGVGKTKLSIMLAKALNKTKRTEIVNCDSMQVYKELNIGVAKIKENEKEDIPHHLFDIVSINDEFSVFDYQKLGRDLINKLLSEDKNIIIVGGTGLYLKALLYDYRFDFDGDKNKPLYDFKLIALTKERKLLYDVIDKRVDMMLDEGLIDEVKSLYDKKESSRVLNKTAIGYKELISYFNNEITKEEAILKIKQSSRRYAKRQFTFFRHQFPSITWYDVDKTSFEEIINDLTK